MCLAVPGKVISVDRSNPDLKMARVQFGAVMKDICIQWLDEVKEGDYILAHVGTAISKIDEADALSTLEVLREMDQAMEQDLS